MSTKRFIPLLLVIPLASVGLRAEEPLGEELASAQEIVDLFAANPGLGTIGHKGAMLDRPYLARAQNLLALAGRG